MSVIATIKKHKVKNDYYNQGCCGTQSVAGGGGTTIHREMAELTGLSDRHVEVTFTTAFVAKPFGQLQVYRYVTQGSGVGKQDVLFTYPSEDWLTETGFIIDIAVFEDLNGIIISYMYTE